ncbi:MAG TPA: Asp-tRNA(Asn)/Glu-tRNA(Gln) amidotransferase subunit GatB [Candidatus Saccharimonadales bacterium]|nr:Asp-tRNA(Asn)/Glu-tRNA(Gln) amidotransferase subunit GatB [Candidatus Saccharimonadales bacterium]
MIRKELLDLYQPTIGIECHVQLNTVTKLFSGASNDDRDQAPNTVVSPICFGLPGTLPVLNERAAELAVRAGHALNAAIAQVSSFDRKHYFYPDLPKGYQITQLDQPIVGRGVVRVPMGSHHIDVRINRAHLEEDAGKLTHPSGANYSLVDLNRAGTPLLEIVSEPDMHSAAEAKGYAQELYLLMKYAGVTRGDLQHGNMRFDVNISVAKKDAKVWGTRVEIKNLNSFKAVERAVEYEVERHITLLQKGERIVQETRGWNEAKQKTISQRSKEEAMDYRYFPEPDVPPIKLSPTKITKIIDAMPKLPPQLRVELSKLQLDAATVDTLILQDALAGLGYVHAVLATYEKAGLDAAVFVANFLVHRDIKQRQETEQQVALPTVEQLCDVFALFKSKQLSSNGADQLLFSLKGNQGASAKAEAEALGLLQENNEAALEAIITEVLADPVNAKAVADIQAGSLKAIGFLVGQVMKASKGKANPGIVSTMIQNKLT